MGLQIKECEERDRKIWDNYVSGHVHGHFMQSWAWGQFRELNGWVPLRLLALHNGIPCGAIQILGRQLLGHGWLLYAPRGPVLNHEDQEVMSSLLHAAHDRYPHAITLRMDPYIQEGTLEKSIWSCLLKLPEEWSFWNGPKYVFWLDISGGADKVFSSLGTKQRNQILYPVKRGVILKRGDAQDAGDFYRLMVAMSQQKKIASHGKAYYHRLLALFCGCGMGNLIFAEVQGRRVACGLSLRYGWKSWLLYAATDREGNHLQSSRAVQWEMIKVAADAGCERYDFRGTASGRIPDPNDPGYGVYKFKKQFNPEFVCLAGYFDFVFQPALYEIFRFVEVKGLPMAYNAYKYIHGRLTRHMKW